jgi:hypothetical protein
MPDVLVTSCTGPLAHGVKSLVQWQGLTRLSLPCTNRLELPGAITSRHSLLTDWVGNFGQLQETRPKTPTPTTPTQHCLPTNLGHNNTASSFISGAYFFLDTVLDISSHQVAPS